MSAPTIRTKSLMEWRWRLINAERDVIHLAEAGLTGKARAKLDIVERLRRTCAFMDHYQNRNVGQRPDRQPALSTSSEMPS